MADDSAICSQIRAYLTPKFASSRRMRLRFSYNGRQYTTILTATHNDTELRLINENSCIDITYNYDNSLFLTDIRADAGEAACFTPRLVSNARNSPGFRTTTLDVLTVFLTKLCTCFPTAMAETPITITDMAIKDEITLSAFHLLRGGDAVYEKYGYTSPFVTELKERIRRLHWRDLDTTTKQLILQLSQESGLPGFFRNGDLLTDILKPITYKIERAFNQRHFDNSANNGEFVNFSEYLIIYLTRESGYNTDFVLDPLSPKWVDWSSRLRFIDFTPCDDGMCGGSKSLRTGRKTRRRRRQQTTRKV